MDFIENLKSLIKEPRTVLVIRELQVNRFENQIIHPYAILFIQGKYFLIGYSDKTDCIEYIDLSEVKTLPKEIEVPFRDIKSNELNLLLGVKNKKATSHSNPSVIGWKEYWNNFNKATDYKVGSRNQWYNIVRNVKFKTSDKSEVYSYLEVCCQYGHNHQLIINLLIESKAGNTDKIEFLHSKYMKLDDTLTKYGFSVDWDIRQGEKRRTIQLCTIDLEAFDRNYIDPREAPDQPKHFKWFTEKLNILCEVFDEYIEES